MNRSNIIGDGFKMTTGASIIDKGRVSIRFNKISHRSAVAAIATVADTLFVRAKLSIQVLDNENAVIKADSAYSNLKVYWMIISIPDSLGRIR